MDDETADLMRRLCTRAGMIMEDASARAVGIKTGDVPPYDALTPLAADGARVAALIAAAIALVPQPSPSSLEFGPQT